jgi:hypothetical protein
MARKAFDAPRAPVGSRRPLRAAERDDSRAPGGKYEVLFRAVVERHRRENPRFGGREWSPSPRIPGRWLDPVLSENPIVREHATPPAGSSTSGARRGDLSPVVSENSKNIPSSELRPALCRWIVSIGSCAVRILGKDNRLPACAILRFGSGVEPRSEPRRRGDPWKIRFVTPALPPAIPPITRRQPTAKTALISR